MLRRKFLGTLVTAVGLSGCFGRENAPGEESMDEARQQNPTTTQSPEDPSDSKGTLPSLTQGRFITGGHELDNVEDVAHWRGDITPDTDRYFNGLQSLKLESATGRAVATADYSADPQDLRDSDLSFAYNPDRPAALSAVSADRPTGPRPVYVDLLAPDSDNRLRLKGTYDSDIGWQRLDLAPFETDGNPDLSRVETMRVALDSTRARGWIDDFRTHPAPDAGKVILRFDDGLERHYTDYFPLLSEYGYPGIEGVVPNLVGGDDYLSGDQLHEMQSAGWEMVCHTRRDDIVTTRPSNTTTGNVTVRSENRLRGNLETIKGWMFGHGFERSSEYFITPFDNYDDESLSAVEDYFQLAFNGSGLTNVALTSPLTIPAVDADGSDPGPVSAIDLAAEHRQLLVLSFHDTDVEDVEEILGHIREKGDRLDVITATQLHKEIARLHNQ